MIKIGIDGSSEFSLVGLVVKLKHLSVVFLVDFVCRLFALVVVTLTRNHFDLVVQQPHSYDLFLQLKFKVSFLELLRFCQLRNENIHRVGILIQFEHSLVQLSPHRDQRSLFLALFIFILQSLQQYHSPSDFFLTHHHQGLFFIFCLNLAHRHANYGFNLNQAVLRLIVEGEFHGGAVGFAVEKIFPAIEAEVGKRDGCGGLNGVGGEEVEISHHALLIGKQDHFHVVAGGQFEYDVPLSFLLFSQFVGDSHQMRKFMFDEGLSFLVIGSEVEALSIGLGEQVGNDKGEIPVEQLGPLVARNFGEEQVGVDDVRSGEGRRVLDHNHWSGHFGQGGDFQFFFLVILVFDLFVLVDFASVGEEFPAFGEVSVDQDEVVSVAVEDFAVGAGDLGDFGVVFSDGVAGFGDLGPDGVQFLQVWLFFLEFCPEIFVEFGRKHHGFFQQRHVVVQTDGFHQVRLALLPVLQVFLDDLLEPVDIELLLEGGVQVEGLSELLVSPLFVVHVFQVEEGVAKAELGTFWELLDARPEHLVYLLQQEHAVVVHRGFSLLFLLLGSQGTVAFVADLFVPFDVADEQHGTIFVVLLVADQFQHQGNMAFQLFPRLELQVVGVKVVPLNGPVIVDNDGEEGQSADPDQQGPVEAVALEKLAHQEHEGSPEVVGRTYFEEFSSHFRVVGLFYSVIPELPEGKHEHNDHVESRSTEGTETEEKLQNYFVHNKDYLSVRVLTGSQFLSSHSGLEESQRHDRRNYHKESDEQKGDRGVEEVPALPAHHFGEINHVPGVAVNPFLALHYVEQGFSDGQEEHSDEQRDYLGQNHQWEGELELLFGEGVADVDDVDDDEQDDEDEGVENEEEGGVGS